MDDAPKRTDRDLLWEIQEILMAHLSKRPLPWERRFPDELAALRKLAQEASDWGEFELLYFRDFPAPQMRREGPEYNGGGGGGGEWV